MRKKPLKIHCGECDFESEDGGVVLDHMIATAHCLPQELVEELKTKPELREEFVEQFRKLQSVSNEEEMRAIGGRPLTEEEVEELELEHPEIEERMRRREQREAEKRQVN